MEKRPVRLGITLLTALALVVALAALTVSACGEGIAEKAIEKAAEQEGQDVDVDIDSKDGSVSISAEDGEVSWQAGEDVDIPEGFPKDLIPDGAKVVSAMTSTESGSPSQMVVFETSAGDKEMYDFYLEALPKAGFEITEKLRMDGGENGSAIAIQAKGPDSTIVVSGGGETGEGYAYTIMVQP